MISISGPTGNSRGGLLCNLPASHPRINSTRDFKKSRHFMSMIVSFKTSWSTQRWRSSFSSIRRSINSPNLKSMKNETTSIDVLEKRIALVKLRCYLSWPPSPPCSCMKVAWQVLEQLIGDAVACFTRSNSVVKGPHLDGLVTRGK